VLNRVAVACLIAGAGLLNVADAGWAHALGVACLIGFVVFASARSSFARSTSRVAVGGVGHASSRAFGRRSTASRYPPRV